MIAVMDRKGRVRDFRVVNNVITNLGKAKVAGLIGGLDTLPVKYVAIGEGDPLYPGSCTTESATDTQLGYETCRKQADSITYYTWQVTNDTVYIQATFSSADGCTGIRNICEAGLFDDITGGILFARATFTPILVDFDVGDKLWSGWYVGVYA